MGNLKYDSDYDVAKGAKRAEHVPFGPDGTAPIADSTVPEGIRWIPIPAVADLATKAPALTFTAVLTSDTALAANTYGLFDCSGGNRTATLPTAPADGTRQGLKLSKGLAIASTAVNGALTTVTLVAAPATALTTGMSVPISGVTGAGATAANGTWPITVLTTTTFTIPVVTTGAGTGGTATAFTLSAVCGGSDTIDLPGGASSAVVARVLNQAIIFQYKAAATSWVVVSSDLPLGQLDLRFQQAGTSVQIGGDIGGAPTAPTVPGLATKAAKTSLVVAAAGGDYTTVAAALAAVPAGGADIFVKRGTYTITNQLVVSVSGTTIRGEGNGTVIVMGNGMTDNAGIVVQTGVTDVRLSDFKVDGNKANQTVTHIAVDTFGVRTTVTGLYIVNSKGYGLHASIGASEIVFANNIVEGSGTEGIESQGASQVTIVGNVVTTAGSNGILVWADSASGGSCADVAVVGNVVKGTVSNNGIEVTDAATNVTVTGNVISGAVAAGIYTDRCTGVTISGNTVRTSAIGVVVQNPSTNVTVTGNIVLAPTQQAILVSQATSLVVANNQVSSTGAGYNGIEMNNSTGLNVSANNVSAAGYAGVFLNTCTDFAIVGNRSSEARRTGILLYDCNNGLISANVCKANGITSAGVENGGITLYYNSGPQANINITGNRCYDDQGTKTQIYGVGIKGACSSITVANNDVTGNKTAGVFLDATSTSCTARGNAGYNPVGHAVTQPSVPATTIAQTNTTGVDCSVFVAGGNVTAVAIGGSSTGATSGLFRVPANQTITLTYTVAPTWQWFGD